MRDRCSKIVQQLLMKGIYNYYNYLRVQMIQVMQDVSNFTLQ
jgi:hypothetical protein